MTAPRPILPEVTVAIPVVRDDSALLFDLLDEALEARRRLDDKIARVRADRAGAIVNCWITLWATEQADAEMRVRLWASTRPGLSVSESWSERDGYRERSIDVHDRRSPNSIAIVTVRACELVAIEPACGEVVP